MDEPDFFFDDIADSDGEDPGPDNTLDGGMDDEPDTCAANLSDDEEEVGDPIQLGHTANMWAGLAGQDMARKIRAILFFMEGQGINLPIFLDALSWGDPACSSDPKIKYARTSLMVSIELPGILSRWYNPPQRTNHRRGKRPAGARASLLDFAATVVAGRIDKEMKQSAPLFLSPPEDFSQESLTSVDFDNLKTATLEKAPITWQVFQSAAYSLKQELRNKYKDPRTVSYSFPGYKICGD